MLEFPYVIVGGGMTAGAAMSGIRKADALGGICLIAGEHHPPYKRPPLSKGLWKGDPAEKIWMKLPANNVTLNLGQIVQRIDARKKVVTDTNGNAVGYDKLLLATGGRVRTFPWKAEGIITFRT